MKKLLAIILAVAMVMSMAVAVSAAEIKNVSVSNPQKTDDGKNIAFALPSTIASGKTAVVHVTGTTAKMIAKSFFIFYVLLNVIVKGNLTA